jgi:hypothetical protein
MYYHNIKIQELSNVYDITWMTKMYYVKRDCYYLNFQELCINTPPPTDKRINVHKHHAININIYTLHGVR